MKMRILAVSATALLCATGAAVAQDDAGAGQSNGAARSGTTCSTLNALSAEMQKTFLQGYQAGLVDAMLAGGVSTGNTANSAGQASDASASTDDQAAAGANGSQVDPALNAGAQKVANGEANNNTAAVAADIGANIDWTPVITGCASAPNSTISSLRAGNAGGAAQDKSQ
ncbi:MAG TPA: hypothetical protein VFO41_02890 [Alphaproteobacteria bacterium]|nr:hypothetical protein [Alphaproteobacteria bacterium]